MAILSQYAAGFKKRLSHIRNRVPAYTITDSGIRHEYVDPKNIENMPFDRDTYPDQQVFLKDYANPIYLDIEDIKDGIDEDNIISSQKYKTYMQQSVLSQVFQGGSWNPDKLKWLLLINCGLTSLFGIIVLAVIAS